MVALALSAAQVVMLSAPRLATGVQMLTADRVSFDLGLGRPVANEDLARAAAGAGRAMDRRTGPEAFAAFGLIRLEQATRGDALSPLGRRQLVEAMKAERAALALDPAAPFDWMRLAQAELLLDGLNARLAVPLKLSLQTGAFEPGLQMPRLDLAFQLWPQLDPPTRAAFSAQVRTAVQIRARAVADMAKRYYVRLYIRQALRADPAALAAFDGAYRAATSTP